MREKIMDDISVALDEAGYLDVEVFQNIMRVGRDDGGDISERHLDEVYDIASMYDSVDVWKDSPGSISIAVSV